MTDDFLTRGTISQPQAVAGGDEDKLNLPQCTSFCQNEDNSNGICRACLEREKTQHGILLNIAKRMTADSFVDYPKWLFTLIEEAIKLQPSETVTVSEEKWHDLHEELNGLYAQIYELRNPIPQPEAAKVALDVKLALESLDCGERIEHGGYTMVNLSDEVLSTIRAALQTPASDGVLGIWQDIETAPVDEDIIVLVGIQRLIACKFTEDDGGEHWYFQTIKEGGKIFSWTPLINIPRKWMPLPTALKQSTAKDGVEKQWERPLVTCASDRDGDCNHPDCPQNRDNEPSATGRSCPIYNWKDDE